MTDDPIPDAEIDTEPARQRLFEMLEALGIETETHDHAPVFTVEENRAGRGALPGAHCKSLFLRDKKGIEWLVVSREDRSLDMKVLAGVIGSGRLSFGSAQRLAARLGVVPGAVSPLALVNAEPGTIHVVLDAEVMEAHVANFHPLRNDATTAIAPGDLVRLIAECGHEPKVVDLAPATRAGDN